MTPRSETYKILLRLTPDDFTLSIMPDDFTLSDARRFYSSMAAVQAVQASMR